MLRRAQTYTRIRGGITAAHAHRACSLGDVSGPNSIRVVLKTALPAAEEALSAAVGLLAMLATRAPPGSIARINRHYHDTSEHRLVFEESPEQRVRPQVVRVSGRSAPSRGALSEVGQLLYGESVAGVQSVHDPAGDGMEHVANEAPLSSGEPIPKLLENPGAFGIELASDFASLGAVVQSPGLHRATGERLARRERGDGGLTDVHTHGSSPTGVLRHFGMDREMHIPLAVLALDQLPALHAHDVGKEMPLVVSDSERDVLSTIYRGEAHRLFLEPESESALIVGYGAVLETASPLTLAPGDTADGLHRKVRRETVVRSETIITEVVERKAPPLTMLSRYRERAVTGIGKGCDSGLQRLHLTRGGLEFTFDRKYGVHSQQYIIGEAVKRQVFLRPLKGAVSNPVSL